MIANSISDPLYRFAVWVIIFQFGLIGLSISVVILLRWITPKLQEQLRRDEARARSLILEQMMNPEREVTSSFDSYLSPKLSIRSLINTFEQVITRIGEHERRILRRSQIALQIEKYALQLTHSWLGWRRLEGVLILRSAGAASAESRLIELLKDSDSNVAFYASWALVRVSPKQSQVHIFEYLSQQNALSFSQKVSVVKELHLELIEVSSLYELFHTLSKPLKAVMIEALILSGHSSALPIIRVALSDTDLEIRIAGFKAAAVSRIGLSDVELKRGLNDPAWPVRAQAVKAVGIARALNLIPALCGCLSDPEWWVRQNSARVLGQMGEAGHRALSTIAHFSEDRFARETARLILSESAQNTTPDTPEKPNTKNTPVAVSELLSEQASRIIDPQSAQALLTMEVSQLGQAYRYIPVPTPVEDPLTPRSPLQETSDHSSKG